MEFVFDMVENIHGKIRYLFVFTSILSFFQNVFGTVFILGLFGRGLGFYADYTTKAGSFFICIGEKMQEVNLDVFGFFLIMGVFFFPMQFLCHSRLVTFICIENKRLILLSLYQMKNFLD